MTRNLADHEVVLKRCSTVSELIEAAFIDNASKPAYTSFGQCLTYKDVDERSRIVASYLRNQLGLEQGDRVAIQLPNIFQFPILIYALIRAGLVGVNINPLYTPREIKHQLVDSEAKALFVLSNCADNAAEIIDETQVKHVVVTDLADELSSPKRQILNFAVKYLKRMVPDFHFKNAVAYRDIYNHQPTSFALDPVTKDSLLVLQYTGGTTGVAKGAMLTHGNLASNVWQMVSHLPEAFTGENKTFVACLPLYHIYAYNLHALCGFCAGAHNILIPNPRDLKAMLNALRPHKFSVFVGINTLFRALVRNDDFKTLDFSELKVTSAGGMALTEDAALDWKKFTGCDVIEGYGLTETSPVVSGNSFNKIVLGSIGTPIPETEIKLLDETGNVVAEGEAGELSVRGPQVMAGYWKRPEATEKVMTKDGFFKTGDIAIKLPEGAYKIVDRKKDMILVSGFNVYPNEVEAVLTSHPDIVEAAVVGVEDIEKGEAIKAFIVKEQEELNEAEVIEYCRDQLTAYKVPQYVEFREELPKSNVGKILRRELRN